MYKVFFNRRTIILRDKQPEVDTTNPESVCTFEDLSDLKSCVMKWLLSDNEIDLYIVHQDSNMLMDSFSSCFQVIHASGGLVKNSKKEDLVIFRRGVWDLPKGKAEPGESSEQTALREVGEECHLKSLHIRRFLLTTYHIYFIDTIPVLKKTRWYEMKYDGKEEPRPQKKEEITKTIWLPYGNLSLISGNTFPNVLEVINTGQR